MRILVAAAAALLGLADAARAVPITFTFTSDRTVFVGRTPDPADDWILGQEGIVTATIVLDLPSIRNIAYDASYGGFGAELTESIPGALVSAGTSLGGWEDAIFGGLGVATDAAGRVVGARIDVASDTPDVSIGFTSVAWGDCCDIWYRGTGSWSVSAPDEPAPVPLPASAPLLALGLAGLVALRRRKAA